MVFVYIFHTTTCKDQVLGTAGSVTQVLLQELKRNDHGSIAG
jgi:hypothetical protein